MTKATRFLILLLLAGCAASLSYDELVEEAQLTGDYTKVRRYEARVEKAREFYENKAICFASEAHIWVCNGARGYDLDDEPISHEEMLRRYRREHWHCGCMKRDDLKELFY